MHIWNAKNKIYVRKMNILSSHSLWHFPFYHKNGKSNHLLFSFRADCFLSYSHRNENSIYHVQFTTKILHALEQYWQVQVLIIIILGVSHIVCKEKKRKRKESILSTFHQMLFSAQTNTVIGLRWGISFGWQTLLYNKQIK